MMLKSQNRISLIILIALFVILIPSNKILAQQEIPDNIKDQILNGTTALESAKVPQDIENALILFNQAAELAPDYPDVHYFLGKTLSLMQGSTGKAVTELKKYLELYPEAPDKEKVNAEIEQLDEVIKSKNISYLMGISLIELPDGIYVHRVSPNFVERISNIGGPSKHFHFASAGDKIEKINDINIEGYSIQDFYKLVEKDTNSYTKISLIRGGVKRFELYTYTKKKKIYSYDVRELGEEDLTTIIKEAETPMVIFFISDWCETCEKYNGYITNRRTYVSDSATFIIANIDENITLAKEFGISQTPVVYFYNDGKLFDKIIGYDGELLKKKAGELMSSVKSNFLAGTQDNNQDKAAGIDSNLYHTVVGTFTDSRDGKTYKTVTIGTQTWMAENLAYKTSSDCWAYDNDETNVVKYGYLYYWETAKEVCPEGWHLPSDAEWLTLTNYLGGEKIAGSKLKGSGTCNWESPNTGATDETSFTALPGGQCYKDYKDGEFKFEGIGMFGHWWSASEFPKNYFTMWIMYFDNTNLYHYPYSRTMGLSVRCIKD